LVVVWTLALGVIDGLVLLIALRGPESRRRRLSVVAAVLVLLGFGVLVAAAVAANLGLLYLAALLLGLGGPVCCVLACGQYFRMRRGPPSELLP
jgi:hypothetical protein